MALSYPRAAMLCSDAALVNGMMGHSGPYSHESSMHAGRDNRAEKIGGTPGFPCMQMSMQFVLNSPQACDAMVEKEIQWA